MLLHLCAATAEVSCACKNQGYLLTGARDGSTKIWSMSDGRLLDAKADPAATAITALTFIGPLMVGGCQASIDDGQARMPVALKP